jgi:septal ring factor EnvC (AmiA/AmiB activator)
MMQEKLTRLSILLSIRFLKLIIAVLVSVNLASELNAEPTQKQIRQDIHNLDGSLNKDQRRANVIRQKLRSIEKKLGEQTRKAYALERKIIKVAKRLEKTKQEKKLLDDQLETQKKGLSQQIVALYSSGEQSHLRLLLKQDDPSDIGRTVKYFEYLNKSRIKKIKRLNKTIEDLHKAESDIINDQKELQHLHVAMSAEKKASEDSLKQRKIAYTKVKKTVKNKKQKLALLKGKRLTYKRKLIA